MMDDTTVHDETQRAGDDDRLLFHNTMAITPGHVDEYRAAIQRAVDFAREHAPQVMVDVFIDEPNLRAHSFQIYADSAAVLEHWKLSDPYIRGVMEHCTVERFEVYGTPSAEVLDGMGTMQFTKIPRLTGFLRDGSD